VRCLSFSYRLKVLQLGYIEPSLDITIRIYFGQLIHKCLHYTYKIAQRSLCYEHIQFENPRLNAKPKIRKSEED
jgi:hypothetical protein